MSLCNCIIDVVDFSDVFFYSRNTFWPSQNQIISVWSHVDRS